MSFELTDPFGTPIFTSPYVPRDQMIRTDRGITVHGHMSYRGRMRRKHGRGRPAPRRLKVKEVFYCPVLDKIKKAQ